MTTVGDDVIYVARATSILSKDLHLTSTQFMRYISKIGTVDSMAMTSAYMHWMANASVSLWEAMIPVGITPEYVSDHYEAGYTLAKMFDELGEKEFASKLRERWDAVLVMLQEIRDEYGEDGPIVRDENDPL